MKGTPSDQPDPSNAPAQSPSPAAADHAASGPAPAQQATPDHVTSRPAPAQQATPDHVASGPAAAQKAATERAAALRAVFAASPRPGQSPEFRSRDLRGHATAGASRDHTGPATPGAFRDQTGPATPGGFRDQTGPATPGALRDHTGLAGPGAGAASGFGGIASSAGQAAPVVARRRPRWVWLIPVVAGAVALGAVAGGIFVSRETPGTSATTDAGSGGSGGEQSAPGTAAAVTGGAAASPVPSVSPSIASAPASSPSATATASPTVAARANPSGANLALRKTATASSIESDPWPASAAVDGDLKSRWSSGFADPQWIKVDLGRVWAIHDVTLAWEHAYAISYRVDVSVDGRRWSTVYRTTAGTDGTRDIRIATVPARYVRMYGTERVSQYGYSLLEFQVR